MKRCALVFLAAVCVARHRRPGRGSIWRTTLSGIVAGSDELTEAPRSGAPATAGFRAMLYSTWKLNGHWTVSAVYQAYSVPYFYQSFAATGHSVKSDLLQSYVGYSRNWRKAALLVRAGELSTAFGSFPLRYRRCRECFDRYADAVWLLLQRGVDPRSHRDPDGFDVGQMGYAGAVCEFQSGESADAFPERPVRELDGWIGLYDPAGVAGRSLGLPRALSRPAIRFFFPRRSQPRYATRASAIGLDVEYARGHWNLQGELQRFQMDYHASPTFVQHAGYAEVKRVLNPRWYLAARGGYLGNNYSSSQYVEAAAGFRPGANQLIKVGYEFSTTKVPAITTPRRCSTW